MVGNMAINVDRFGGAVPPLDWRRRENFARKRQSAQEWAHEGDERKALAAQLQYLINDGRRNECPATPAEGPTCSHARSRSSYVRPPIGSNRRPLAPHPITLIPLIHFRCSILSSAIHPCGDSVGEVIHKKVHLICFLFQLANWARMTE